MKEQLTQDMSLKLMERIIIEELSGKDLWGDIDFTYENYEALRNRIKEVLERYNIKKICAGYPIAVTTFLVFMMRYKYNTNFWGMVESELGIELYPGLEGEIGKYVRKTFSAHGFDFSDVKDERRVNMEPILFEAGIPPESSLDDLFYVLQYDSHHIFDPQLIIEDLIDDRSYQIRKPLLRFLKRYQNNRALEFVLEVHDAMISVSQSRSGDSRYVEIYTDWKQQSVTGESRSNRKKQEFQAKPYLAFENGKRGLCMVLPRAIIANEWIDDVSWEIVCDDEAKTSRKMTVFGDESGRYVQSIQVPVSPAASYHVMLRNDEKIETNMLLEWIIPGIPEGGILYFNAIGRQVTPSYLQLPFGIMVLSKEAKIISAEHITTLSQAYPTDKPGYQIVALEPLGRDASLTYESNHVNNVLKARPQVNFNFEGKNAFGVINSDSAIFTDIPELYLKIDEAAIPEEMYLFVGKEKVDITKRFENAEAHINLKRLFGECFDDYGTYGVRLYQRDRFIKQAEFTYIPKFKTNYTPVVSWPNRQTRKDSKKFRFEKKEGWDLSFEGCQVSTDEDNYIVECPANMGILLCDIKKQDEDSLIISRVELPIRPFSMEIVSNGEESLEQVTDRIASYTLKDVDEEELWLRLECYGEYKNHPYSIQLRTSNGIEQSESVRIARNGACNFNLSVFYETIRTCPLPAQIELVMDDNETSNTYPIAIIKDFVELSSRPALNRGKATDFISISINDDNRDIAIKRFGTLHFEETIKYGDSCVGKKGKRRGYPIGSFLEDGIYAVEASKESSDLLFEDDIPLQITNGNNILYISSRGKEEPIENVSSWLDQLVRDIIAVGVNRDLQNCRAYSMRKRISDFENISLSSFDYERLVVLAAFASAKCMESKKNMIKECMALVSRHILDNHSRLEILRVLGEVDCTEEIFEICLEYYDLWLFEQGTYDAKQLASKIEDKSPELSMLLLMGVDASIRDTIWREKYRDLIGREAIRALMSVPDETELEAVVREQKNFLREMSPCRVKISLTDEISGDLNPISKMLVWDTKTPYMDFSKKPDEGIYFYHIRYVDQYVNWYTLSHDKEGNMYPWKRSLMLNVVQENCKNIVKMINNLKRIKELSMIVTEYEKALKSRITGDIFANMNANDHQRYFYLQGMAAFMAKLPKEYYEYGWAVRTGEAFMIEAMKIAPRMACRDIMLASTFIYLKRKEEKLCQ